MSMTLSSIRTAVRTVRRSLSRSRPSFVTCCTRLTEPRLHTAISSRDVFSVISVHRFDDAPHRRAAAASGCCTASLNVIHGWPVSNSIDSILRHRSCARTRLNSWQLAATRSCVRSSCTRASNARPYRSCSSGTSLGENSVQVPSSNTRFMNRSGIQFAVFMSCVRRRSSPVFLRSSRNSSMSRCHVSRYAHTAPLRLPPWLTATAVSLTTFRNGTTPCDLPLVPLM